MNSRWRTLQWYALVLAAGCSVQCAPAASPGGSGADVVLLDCAAADIHHVFRIRPAGHTVDDLSVSPAKRGDADLSQSEYLLRFHEPRDRYDLVLQINRETGRGTRQLFDDEQQPIRGHGGTDDIVCTPGAPPH